MWYFVGYSGEILGYLERILADEEERMQYQDAKNSLEEQMR
jgi:hypothetical protein